MQRWLQYYFIIFKQSSLYLNMNILICTAEISSIYNVPLQTIMFPFKQQCTPLNHLCICQFINQNYSDSFYWLYDKLKSYLHLLVLLYKWHMSLRAGGHDGSTKHLSKYYEYKYVYSVIIVLHVHETGGLKEIQMETWLIQWQNQCKFKNVFFLELVQMTRGVCVVASIISTTVWNAEF